MQWKGLRAMDVGLMLLMVAGIFLLGVVGGKAVCELKSLNQQLDANDQRIHEISDRIHVLKHRIGMCKDKCSIS